MKKIMIDMDEVICDTGKRFLELVNTFLNTNYTEDDVEGYYIQNLIPDDKRSEWAEFFNKQNIYEHINFMPDALEIMEKLSKKYELYVVTAYIFKDNPIYSANNLKYKFEWLMENIPFINPRNYIFTTDKEIIDCDIKIDDRTKNLTGNADMKLLFTAYHNKEFTDKELEEEGIVRVNNWKDIEKILL